MHHVPCFPSTVSTYFMKPDYKCDKWGCPCMLFLSNTAMYFLPICIYLFLLPDRKLLKARTIILFNFAKLYYGDMYCVSKINLKGKNLIQSNHPWKALRKGQFWPFFIKFNIRCPLVLEQSGVSLHPLFL